MADTKKSSTSTVDELMQAMSLLPCLPMQADPFNSVPPVPGQSQKAPPLVFPEPQAPES